MSIESDLKKDGIEVIQKLDTLKINSIAKNVSTRICETFPNFNLNQNELFIKLSRLNMYIANIPEGMAEASYFFRNSSIYFNSHLDYEDIEEFAIHECIHNIQEVKDNKNYLIRMGLCDYTEFNIYGLALNEAAVQLMSSKILGIPEEFVKYYNISFKTNSPTYYPLECCLVKQLAYLIGENTLFESTINSTDTFKSKLISIIGERNFYTIQKSIDKILTYQEDIIKLNNKIQQLDETNKKINSSLQKIDSLKSKITASFIKTQNIIISSYFDSTFSYISNLEEVENYRRKLYNFKDYLGTTDEYTYFNDYYVDRMVKLEELYYKLENAHINNSLSVISKKTSILLTFIKIVKKLLRIKKSENTEFQKD
ncbi:MAG: hypothetical protein HFJ59_07200 [Clostridia bacterium]|nr:hypothetical protein [Clostridia bacterium]